MTHTVCVDIESGEDDTLCVSVQSLMKTTHTVCVDMGEDDTHCVCRCRVW